MIAFAARIAPTGLRRPRPTARLRLTLFYSALFVLSAACLLAIPYLLVRGQSTGTITYNPTNHTYTYVGPDREVYGATAVPPQPGAKHTGFRVTNSRAVVEQLRALAVNQHNSELHHLLVYSLIALAVMAAISVLVGWLVAGRVLRPVRTISATARRISATNLHHRLALDGPDDEFKELGATLDDLFERLEASFESQRRFVANASHELRTPLTVERTLLQVALADPDTTLDSLRGVCEKLLVSGAQQERLIDALLTLASSERGLEQPEPFDLAEITGQVLAHGAAERIGHEGLHLDTTLAPAPTLGDPRLAQRLVANLIDNAIRYNSDHGEITVRTGTRADTPFLSVANTGSVIPQSETGRLLEPFQQLGRQRTGHRNGHGLGLAIVAAIADAHHANLSLRPRPTGGLRVDVRFPPSTGPVSDDRSGSAATSTNGRRSTAQKPPAAPGGANALDAAHAGKDQTESAVSSGDPHERIGRA